MGDEPEAQLLQAFGLVDTPPIPTGHCWMHQFSHRRDECKEWQQRIDEIKRENFQRQITKLSLE